MAKFSKGDKVVQISSEYGSTPFMTRGVVDEDNSELPFVNWDLGDGQSKILAEKEEYLMSIDPSSEIAHILETAVEREQSNNELQKYTFTYTDINREITHVFKEEMLEYDLEDVMAEFRAFLLGLGFTAEHIGGLIDDSKL